MPILAILLSFLSLAARADTDMDAGAPAASVRVGSEALRPFSREFFGLNFEWGRALDLAQTDPASGGDDPELARLCAGLPLPANRMAGTVSQVFHWKQALGPLDARTPQKLNEWEKEGKPIRVGPVEWVKWVTGIDPRARYLWTINILDETPQDAADLVQFLTGDAATPWGKRRAELGLPQPVKVAWWELGNEMNLRANEHKDYVWTAEQYVAAVKPFIAAIRAADPRAKLAADGSCYRDDWDGKVVRGLAGQVDAIAPHYYYRSVARGRDETVLKPGAFQGADMPFVFDWLRDLVGTVHAATVPGGRPMEILITEHAMWPLALKDAEWRATWYQTHSLDGVVTTADFLVRALAVPEVTGTYYHNFSSGPWGLVYRDPATRKLYATGMSDLFRLLGTIPEGSIVACETSGPGETAPVAAAIARPGSLSLVVVNPGAPRPLDLGLPGEYRLRDARGIWGDDLDAHNVPGAAAISIRPLPGAVPGSAPKRLLLPGRSVAVVSFDAAPSGPAK